MNPIAAWILTLVAIGLIVAGSAMKDEDAGLALALTFVGTVVALVLVVATVLLA